MQAPEHYHRPAGSIHKGINAPPLPSRVNRANFRSIENKRRVASVHNQPQRNNNPRNSR
jgi:hypothetical protein